MREACSSSLSLGSHDAYLGTNDRCGGQRWRVHSQDWSFSDNNSDHILTLVMRWCTEKGTKAARDWLESMFSQILCHCSNVRDRSRFFFAIMVLDSWYAIYMHYAIIYARMHAQHFAIRQFLEIFWSSFVGFW